jgi:lipid II:glycine glycyltransferase (peptidoglycan interpeptide bridge formation enzyme)
MKTSENETCSEVYKVQICRVEVNREWDIFVSGISGANYEQTAAWASICNELRASNDSFRIILRSGSSIIAGAQVLIREYRFGLKMGYISQGPCLAKNSPEVTSILIEEFKKVVKVEKLMYLSIDVLIKQNHLVKPLKDKGFIKPAKDLPPGFGIDCTSLIDLSKSEVQLFSSLHSARKRNIKTGLKFDYEVKEGNRGDVSIFFDLMMQACRRRKTKPVVTNIKYFYLLWDQLHQHGWLKLHFAIVEGVPVCAALCFTFGDTFRYDLWGWNGEYSKEKISETFLWKNLLWAKELGFKYYDCVMLDPKVVIALQSDKPVPEKIKKKEFYGPTHFKMRWGGEIVFYPGVHTYFRNVFFMVILNTVYKTILSGTSQKMIKKMMTGLRSVLTHKKRASSAPL